MAMTSLERQTRYLSKLENRVKKRARDGKRRVSRKAAGMCLFCGLKEPLPERRYCDNCRESFLEYHKELRVTRINQGLCAGCGNAASLPGARHGGRHTLCEVCVFKKLAKQHLGKARLWELLRDKLAQQDFCCAYTGARLVLGENASVDHVFPVHHYPHLKHHLSNLEWVCLEVNEMKRDRTPEQFLSLIKSIMEFRLQALTSPVAECVA